MKVKIKYLFMGLIIALMSDSVNAQNSNVSYLNLIKLNEWWNNSAVRNAREVMQDNEFECHQIGNNTDFHANPLLLNGKILDYGNFSFNSKGVLTVVKGKPGSAEATPIPFFVSIRRDGKVLEDKKMPFLNKTLYKVSLSEIFPFSEHEDVLIIKPAREEDCKAKRILKLLGGC